MDAPPTAASPGMKPAAGIAAPPQPTKIATPPLTGIGKVKSFFFFSKDISLVRAFSLDN